MSTNGKKDKILYTKLNAEDLTILAEGELNIPAPTNWLKLTSSGILTYRKSDNRLYYFYYWKETDGLTNIDQQEPNFHTAIINPSTMEVEKDVLSPIECEMAGSAYGELMQNCVMYDEADNLYLACFHEEDNAFLQRHPATYQQRRNRIRRFLQRLSQCRRQIADHSISGREQSLSVCT